MNVLIVTSSAQGEKSVSSQLAATFADQLRAARPDTQIVTRDVGAEPIPHLVAATVAGVRADASTPEEIAASDLSNALIAEVKAADLLVIASPMYNFGISSTLKAWFDHVLRPRVAFFYDAEGPHGLLGGRKAIVIEAQAGVYEAGSPADSQEPHLRQMLGFAGIDDVTFVRANRLAFAAEQSIAEATAQLQALARNELPLAA